MAKRKVAVIRFESVNPVTGEREWSPPLVAKVAINPSSQQAKPPTKRQRQASSQRTARVIAESCRREFEAGDRLALMTAIYFCLKADVVVPPWAAEAFVQRYRAIAEKQAGSWDDVFGRPLQKRKRLKPAQRNEQLRWQVWSAVHDAKEPKDDGLFAKVGKRFGIGRSTCSTLYYEADREVRENLKLVAALPD